MKTVLTVAVAALFSTAALADHTVENAQAISRAAYRVADSAEAIEQDARYQLGGVLDPVTDDHRNESLREIFYGGRATHLAASDLYRAARNGFEPTDGDTDDHRGDDIRESYQRLRFQYDSLARSYSQCGFEVGPRLRYEFEGLVRTFNDLEWYVWGHRPQ